MEGNFLLRLIVACLLGTLIGLDREYRAKEAGFRTHFLVSLGSALIMIVSQYGFQDIIRENGVTLDPSRVAAQVVSGIGFIGAGTILIQKKFVRGLTTAAGLWATAGIGLAIGAGMFIVGIAATVFTLIGLEALTYLFKSVGMRNFLIIFTTPDKDILKKIAHQIDPKGFRIMSYEMEETDRSQPSGYRVSIVFKAAGNIDENQLLLLLNELPELVIEKIE